MARRGKGSDRGEGFSSIPSTWGFESVHLQLKTLKILYRCS